MKRLDFRNVLGGLVVALLVGCGGSRLDGTLGPPYSTSVRSPQQTSGTGYQVLYRFQGNSNSVGDGDSPHSSLVAIKDRLYGTTALGGDLNYSACGSSKFFAGCGTAFEVSTSGKERVLFRFAGGSGGFFPLAGSSH